MSDTLICLQRLGSIADGKARYKIPRNRWYALAKQHPGLLKRVLNRTLIDFAVADEIINNAPDYRAVPAGQRGGNLVNVPGGRVSKVVAAARARKAKAGKSQA
jgi:hypothetical protein